MKTKQFIIYSCMYLILLTAGLFLFFHTAFKEIKSINIDLYFYSYEFSYPVAIFVLAPQILFIVLMIILTFFSNLSSSFEKRRLKKDSEKFDTLMQNLLLNKDSNIKFSTSIFDINAKKIKKILLQQIDLNNDDISEILAMIANIKQGKVVDLKAYKLSKNNPLYINNQINIVKNDLNYANNYLRAKSEIDDEISLAAYKNIINNDDYSSIKQLRIQKSTDDIMLIINRFFNDEIKLSNAEFEILISNKNLTMQDYFNIAKKIIDKIEPNSIKAIFFKLLNTNEEVKRAYFYVLAKLSLYEELREKLHYEDGYEDFKLLIFLKDNNKNYDLDKLIY